MKEYKKWEDVELKFMKYAIANRISTTALVEMYEGYRSPASVAAKASRIRTNLLTLVKLPGYKGVQKLINKEAKQLLETMEKTKLEKESKILEMIYRAAALDSFYKNATTEQIAARIEERGIAVMQAELDCYL